MPATLAHILRHPIKSLGREALDAVTLAPDAWMPGDRVWALAHDRTGAGTGWKPKVHFLRGVTAPALMAVRSRTGADGRITLSHPDRPDLTLDPDRDEGALASWVAPLWPDTQPAPRHLVRAGDAHLTDVPDPWIAILNLASLDALAGVAGVPLSIHRWRGNLWLDGLAQWEEKSWPGREIAIGEVRLEVTEEITRCKATAANPETGERDTDTLAHLRTLGHQEFGVYARVTRGGTIRPGDTVTAP